MREAFMLESEHFNSMLVEQKHHSHTSRKKEENNSFDYINRLNENKNENISHKKLRQGPANLVRL